MWWLLNRCSSHLQHALVIVTLLLSKSSSVLFDRRIDKEYKMKIKQKYFLYTLKLCLYSWSQKAPAHPAPELEPVMSLAFFFCTSPCDLPPSQSIMTIAAATVPHASHSDSLSSVSLPFIRTLMASHSPDAQPWLSHKENISFLGRRYYNSEISFAFMAASHLESLFDVVISLRSWCSW